MGQRLGQHFLVKTSILERIARSVCEPGLSLPVIEIGPGRGALTRYLAPAAPRLIAIELDASFAERLSIEFPALELIRADALSVDLSQWGPVVVCGNLPYYITSPILDKTLSLGPLLHHAVFLMQKEVAERLIAKPGSRDYGYLSVRTQALSEPALLFPVSPKAFQPPPKVDSAVVKLIPRATPLTADLPGFLKFAGLCFHQKRKNLRNNLGGAFPAIDAMPEARLRAEQLGLAQLADLYTRLRQTA